jgi:FkbM family methyltransferase
MFTEFADNNICVLPIAISNENSIASFMIAARGRASNALEVAGGRSQMGGIRQKQYVPTMTLDALLKVFPSPDFVKIDIEGAEYIALQGATQLINEIRPIFYIEIGKDTKAQVAETFKTASYIPFEWEARELKLDCSNNTLGNIFFIPEEKKKEFQKTSEKSY